MKKLLLLLIVLILTPGRASSEQTALHKTTDLIELETRGQGINRDEAIKNALHQAVAQARGVKVDSGQYEFGYRSASADIDRQDSKKQVEFDAVSVETGGTVLRTEIEGLVKTYEVLDEKQISDGMYEVTLKVWVYDYFSPEQTSRFKLAVMPIRTLSDYYHFGTLRTSGHDISRKLAHSLSIALTQTNKFAVLDREYIEEFAHNRNILLYDDSPLEEKAKLGQVLGADYMLVGTISDARIEIEEKTSSAIGRPIREYEADFVFDYSLLVGPTRQVKLADAVRISLEGEQLKKLVRKWERDDLDFREMTDNLISMAANQVVGHLIDRLYPVRIASIDKNARIIINQGGKRILNGLLLEIFDEGEEVLDLDTNESLGRTELLIATIIVDDVFPGFSYAKLVDGDLSKISEGMICRPKKVQEKPLRGLKSDIERSPTGGVKLPFD